MMIVGLNFAATSVLDTGRFVFRDFFFVFSDLLFHFADG